MELKIPILGHRFGFGEAVFLRARAAILASEITGTLSVTAVWAFVDVNFAAHDGELFGHDGCPPHSSRNAKVCKSCVRVRRAVLYIDKHVRQ